MAKKKIDAYDKLILSYLDFDSHLTFKQLGTKIGKSKEFVGYRIKKLEDSGIILKNHAIVDMSKLGYEIFRIYIKWQYMTFNEKEAVHDVLLKNTAVWTLAKLHGKWDFAIFIGIKHSNEFQKIWNEIELMYKNKIADYKIAIYSPIYNFNKRFLDHNFSAVVERKSGGNTVIDHDELDEKIIYEYGRDVRKPLHEIATKFDVAIETVRKRIKRLEVEKVISGYKIDMDLSKLGYQGYRVDFYLHSVRRNKELFEYIKQHPLFYQINESIGGADFETEIVVTDLVQLLDVLEEVVQRFKDVVRYYEYFGYTGFPHLSIIPD